MSLIDRGGSCIAHALYGCTAMARGEELMKFFFLKAKYLFQHMRIFFALRIF